MALQHAIDHSVLVAVRWRHRFDGNDMPEAYDFHVLRQRVMRLGSKRVQSKVGNETEARVFDLNGSLIRESQTKRNKRVSVQLLG